MVKGDSSKNLFLKDKKTNDFFLVIMPANKKADLKKIKVLTKAKHLTFGKPEELAEILSLEPGSVSPFGLLNDKKNEVKLYVDLELWEAEKVSFYPNQNDETIELEKKMFQQAIENMDNEFEIVDL